MHKIPIKEILREHSLNQVLNKLELEEEKRNAKIIYSAVEESKGWGISEEEIQVNLFS